MKTNGSFGEGGAELSSEERSVRVLQSDSRSDILLLSGPEA